MVFLMEIEYGLFALRKEFIKRDHLLEKLKKLFVLTVFLSFTLLMIVW